MKRSGEEKKPGPKEPGLRYWPREADTITFQEGLLSARATGGGGHMRDTIAQRVSTMIPIGALRKLSKPHVRHAETGAFIRAANPPSGMTKRHLLPKRFRAKWIPVRVKKTR